MFTDFLEVETLFFHFCISLSLPRSLCVVDTKRERERGKRNEMNDAKVGVHEREKSHSHTACTHM
jgi:hypothetical protein